MTSTQDAPTDEHTTSTSQAPATRRAAEKAAAELLQQQLLGPITDLFETRQALSSDAIETAEAEARRIVEEAQARADQVREDARRRQDDAHEAYTSAYRAAQQRGWTSDQLDELGYTKPKRTRRRNGTKSTPQSAPQGDTSTSATDEPTSSPEATEATETSY